MSERLEIVKDLHKFILSNRTNWTKTGFKYKLYRTYNKSSHSLYKSPLKIFYDNDKLSVNLIIDNMISCVLDFEDGKIVKFVDGIWFSKLVEKFEEIKLLYPEEDLFKDW